MFSTLFLKIIMCVINSVNLFLGGTIMGIGILFKMNSICPKPLLDYTKDGTSLAELANVSYLPIACGAVLAFIGFLGFWGVLRNNKCLLLLFFVINLVMFLAEAVIAVIAMVYQSENVIGGFDAMVKMVKENSLLGALAICVAVLEVGAMIVSIILYKNLGEETEMSDTVDPCCLFKFFFCNPTS